MPNITVHNKTIHYQQTGHGDPMILISGLTADHSVWKAMVPLLSQYYQVLTFDNLGVGASSDWPAGADLSMMVEILAGLMEQLHIRKAHLVGHSMGGIILQAFCAQYPQYVAKAVFLTTCSRLPLAAATHIKNQLNLKEAGIERALIIEQDLPWLFSCQFLNQSNQRETLKKYLLNKSQPQSVANYKAQAEALIAADTNKLLSEIQADSLVMVTDQDTLIPSTYSEPLEQLIPQATTCVIKDAGHMLHLEQPSLVSQKIIDFTQESQRTHKKNHNTRKTPLHAVASSIKTTHHTSSPSLLLVNSSANTTNAHSRVLTSYFLERWQHHLPASSIIQRDVGAKPIPHLENHGLEAILSKDYTTNPSAKKTRELSNQLIDEIHQSDILVFGVPMYNFTIPSTLKAYFDHIARVNKTFQFSEQGPVGLLENKQALIITTAGGMYYRTYEDFITPYLKTFLKFIGIEDIHFIHVPGTAIYQQDNQFFKQAQLAIADFVYAIAHQSEKDPHLEKIVVNQS